MFSKTRQHLWCNLLFGLIGHFGLLKDVTFVFLSLSLSLCVQYREVKQYKNFQAVDTMHAEHKNERHCVTRITPTTTEAKKINNKLEVLTREQ